MFDMSRHTYLVIYKTYICGWFMDFESAAERARQLADDNPGRDYQIAEVKTTISGVRQ